MAARTVRFGPFQADLDSGELYRDGIRLKLGGQAFQVLDALVSRPGELVTREELRNAIWESGTFVDFDQGLNHAVKRIREVLCDSATTPRFIETVARRGYRFIAPLHRPHQEAPAPAPVLPISAPLARVIPRWVLLGGICCLAVVGLFSAARFDRPVPAALPDSVPLTSSPGGEYGATFSPGGRQVAYYWAHPEPSRRGIYVKPVDSKSDKATPLVVEPPSDNFSPAWSPDGKTIAFIRRTPDAEVWLHFLPVSGGPSRRAARLATSRRFFAHHLSVGWGPDSKWVIARASFETDRSIQRISTDGEIRTFVSTEGSVFSPSVAPSGAAFLYQRRIGAASSANSEVVLQALNAQGLPEGDPRVVFQTPGGSRGIAWVPGEKEMVICTEQPGVGWRLFRVSLDGRSARGEGAATLNDRDCTTVTISRPDSSGHSLMTYGASAKTREARLFEARLDNLSQAAEFSPSSRPDTFPAFSPDGKSVAFVSGRSGSSEIWLAKPDGSDAWRLTDGAKVHEQLAWSPDGKYIAFESGVYSPAASAIVSTAGGPQRRIGTENRLSTYPAWSRDGKWVYFKSGLQIWKSRPDGREPLMLADGDQLTVAGEALDAKSLIGTSIGSLHSLIRIPLSGGRSEVLDEGLAVRNVAMTKAAAYFFRDRDRSLYRLPLGGGQPQRLGELPVPGPSANLRLGLFGFTVSPDDTRLVWSARDAEIDLELVRAFR